MSSRVTFFAALNDLMKQKLNGSVRGDYGKILF